MQRISETISGRLVYQRFSPQEQHGCSAGGTTNVIASLLSGAEAGTDSEDQGAIIGSRFVSLLDECNGNADEALDKLFEKLKD